MIADEKIVIERKIEDENSFLIYRFVDSDVLVTLGFVGCPACAGNLDLLMLWVLQKLCFTAAMENIEVEQIFVVDGAIKDEGAKIAEMEHAGRIAVSQFREFEYGALTLRLYN